MREQLALPSDSASPRRARQFVDEVLHRWQRDGAIERLALIASELVTNAVQHGRTKVSIELSATEGSVRIEVFDQGVGRPTFIKSDLAIPGGLGLPIVEALAASWGVTSGNDGKGVWAEVNG